MEEVWVVKLGQKRAKKAVVGRKACKKSTKPPQDGVFLRRKCVCAPDRPRREGRARARCLARGQSIVGKARRLIRVRERGFLQGG